MFLFPLFFFPLCFVDRLFLRPPCPLTHLHPDVIPTDRVTPHLHIFVIGGSFSTFCQLQFITSLRYLKILSYFMLRAWGDCYRTTHAGSAYSTSQITPLVPPSDCSPLILRVFFLVTPTPRAIGADYNTGPRQECDSFRPVRISNRHGSSALNRRETVLKCIVSPCMSSRRR